MGMLGELYIGGKQVTKGYLNKPELTKEKFIVSNINQHTEILYKTGELFPEDRMEIYSFLDETIIK